MNDKERIIGRLDAALMQMHSPEGYEYTSEDVNELEIAAWDALNLLQESNLIKKEEKMKKTQKETGMRR